MFSSKDLQGPRREFLKSAAAVGAVQILGAFPSIAMSAQAAVRPPGRLKYVTFLVRKEGMTRQQFLDHWLGIHGPMAKKVPGLRGFILNEVTENPKAGFGSVPNLPQIDGVAESYAENLEQRQAMLASPEAKEWFADGDKFIDRQKSKTLTTLEHMYIRPQRSEGSIKRFGLMVRLAGLSRPDYIKHWLDIHGPMAHTVPGLSGFAISQFTGNAQPEDFDGIVESWSPSLEARTKTFATDEAKAWMADGDTFMNKKDSKYVVTKEHVVINPHVA